jgi:hypothetical protein
MASVNDDWHDTEDFINCIVKHALPKYVSKDKLLNAFEKDPNFFLLKNAIKSGTDDILNNELEPYAKVFTQLSVTEDGLILKDFKLVIPPCLENDIIEIAHQGHMGIVKTKQLIRSKVWFPKIDSKVEA